MEWDRDKFRGLIEACIKNGFMGIPAKSKEDVYKSFGKMLNVQPGTVKSWLKIDSKGPGVQIWTQLESIFNINLSKNLQSGDDDLKLQDKKMIISETSRMCIQSFYALLYSHILEDIEKVDKSGEVYEELDKIKMVIPNELYVAFSDFIIDHLDQFAYSDEVYEPMRTDELGYYDEDGRWQIKDEESKFKTMVMFFN